MIEPGHERVQDRDEPGFTDAVAVHVWLPEQSSLAALRIARRPAAATTSAAALILTAGNPVARTTTEDQPLVEDWADASTGPVTLRTVEPLRQWTAAVQTNDAALECELRALGPPVEVTHVPGLHRYAQLCAVESRITTAGKQTQAHGRAVRTHSSGTATGARRRFVTAATAEGALVEVAADRAHASDGHGDEQVGGEMLDARDWAGPLEEVRLSTVYDASGMPRKAGLELYRPGDEFPARLSGQAVGGATMELAGRALTIAFFDWRLAGGPAWGTYELESTA